MVKYAPRKVYIRESGGYVELSYTEFCRCRESDQTYMDKLFIPIQGCLLEVVREQYTDFYRDKERWRYLQKLDTKNRLLKELDATVINALIDKILVSEREKMADGTVKQEIKIYYKFIGFVDELHIIPTKRWAAMPAKNCTVCGVEYVPGSGASRYCPACAKKIRREKSNESKRRSREQKRIACMNCPQKMTD